MKSIIKILLIIIFSILVIKAQTESLPLIEDLEKGDYLAILTINADRLVEYVPYLDTSIFKQKHFHIVREYLEALSKLNSSNIIPISKAFIDSLDSPYFLKDEKDKIDITESKLFATEILFEHGDYTTAQYIFDYIDSNRENLRHYVFFIRRSLKLILKNVPSLAEQAKTELIYMAQNNSWDEMRWLALLDLNNVLGSEINYLNVDRLINDEYSHNRVSAIEFLLKNDYPDLDELIIERLYADTSRFARIVLAETLLDSIGTPINYNAVKNYLEVEQNQIARSNIEVALELFWPKPPYKLNTVMEYLNYTSSLCDTLPLYTWLGDLAFSNELKNLLTTAKTKLQNGDSVACAIQIKDFQDKVDFVYKDSLNSDPRFVTIEGWKFLYSNAYYILDRLPEIPSFEGLTTYSIFATHGVWLEQNSEIISGNIGINDIGTPPFMDSDVEMSIGISTETPAGFSVKANRIKVKQNATVNADVYYNELENNGTITGTLNTPLELPLFATLPEFHTSTPGTENIVIPQNGEYTLTPGAYGEIQVKKNGKLIFTGGEYHINKLTAGDDNQLLFQSESEVRIKDKFDSGQGSYIGPQDTTTLSTDEIIFYVEGINGSNGNLGSTPKAAKIGISNTVKANFYVPNGTLWLRQNSEVEGSFIGKDVDVGIGVKVKLNSAF